jgi:hypothetical protein
MDRWKMELRKKKAKNAELTDDYKKFQFSKIYYGLKDTYPYLSERRDLTYYSK